MLSLTATRRTYNQTISTTELDMTSPSFASFYNANTAGGTGGGSYYDCSRWAQVRGLMVSPCPAGTAFTATTYAGRSHFERYVDSFGGSVARQREHDATYLLTYSFLHTVDNLES